MVSPVQLLTWNTQWCCGLDGKVDPQRIVATARAMADFDVLCLQEIADNYPALRGAPAHDQPALLARLLPGFQLFFGPAVDAFGAAGRQRFGNLIATRLPVLQVQHHPLPYPADGHANTMPRMCSVVTLQAGTLGALRVMTTHLEFSSPTQRMAQAQALRALHREACANAAAPPRAEADGTPFQARAHTRHALLCGDFNFTPASPEYRALQADADDDPDRLRDAWPMLHGSTPHAPTFCCYDHTYGPAPIACDFVFASASLLPRLRRIAVDGATQASDHQPVLIELA